MNPEECMQWSQMALAAAKTGGRVLDGFFRKVNPSSVVAKQRNDWVSEADRASEREIIGFINREAPSHSILTEEAGFIPASGRQYSPFCWIIDPLDGTTNFLRGFPFWAVSIGLEYRPEPNARWGEIIAGAIVIPPTGEVFHAALGGGAFRNGVKLKLGAGREMSASLLATGFPFRIRSLHQEYADLLRDVLGRCADVRRPGAVAIDLCYTAAGVFDGFWELDLSPWDVAAGGLIIRESGGQTANFQGDADYMTSGDIVAGHPLIFNELICLVQRYFPRPREVNKAPNRNR